MSVPPLKVLVSGGGPAGLICSITLAEYFKQNGLPVQIVVYENRISQIGKNLFRWKYEFEGQSRRRQVVTLQDSVLAILPEVISRELVSQERVWPNSRNIPIYSMEDILLQIAQRYPDEIQFNPAKFNKSELDQHDGFDVLVGADGRNSAVRTLFSKRFGNFEVLESEQALGICLNGDHVGLTQAMNVVLTLSQMRYLLNSREGKFGYLNVRLTADEMQEFIGLGGYPSIKEFRDSNIWRIIQDGLALFNLPEEAIERIDPIGISFSPAGTFVTEMTDYQNNRDDNVAKHPVATLIGDAAFSVHFWPGRGMNTAAKAAIGLARRLYWAHVGEDRVNQSGAIRFRSMTKFESMMCELRFTEVTTRSAPIVNLTPIISNIVCPVAAKQWMDEVIGKLDNYEVDCPSNYWPHDKADRGWLTDHITSLPTYLRRSLASSKPWPIEAMRVDEVDPHKMCASPVL